MNVEEDYLDVLQNREIPNCHSERSEESLA